MDLDPTAGPDRRSGAPPVRERASRVPPSSRRKARSSSGAPRAAGAGRARCAARQASLDACSFPAPTRARDERRLVMERHALRQSFSACQWMRPITCTGISGYRTRKPARLAVRERDAAAVEHRGQRPPPLLAHVDPRPHLVLRLGERVLVALVEAEERRDVEPLRRARTDGRRRRGARAAARRRCSRARRRCTPARRPGRSTSGT